MNGDPFADVTHRLSTWAEAQGLVGRARQGVAGWLRTDTDMGGWSAAEVRVEFRTHSLCFTSALLPYAYVTTTLNLYAPDGTEIGSYRLITTTDGKADDDYFVIDVKKPAG